MTKYEQPAVTAEGGGDRETHPAYAQISASRVNGRIYLYGSDFDHRHYVVVKIARSSTKRDLSHDWPHAELEPYVEVAMSEAQWAEFVSSMNIGGGPRCTLQYVKGVGEVAQIPPVKSRRDQFVAEMRETVEDALQAAQRVVEALKGANIPAKTRERLLADAERVLCEIKANVPFVAQQFDGHVEATLNRARTEINAYAETVLVRAGIEALGSAVESPLRLREEMTDNEAIAVQEADADRPE